MEESNAIPVTPTPRLRKRKARDDEVVPSVEEEKESQVKKRVRRNTARKSIRKRSVEETTEEANEASEMHETASRLANDEMNTSPVSIPASVTSSVASQEVAQVVNTSQDHQEDDNRSVSSFSSASSIVSKRSAISAISRNSIDRSGLALREPARRSSRISTSIQANRLSLGSQVPAPVVQRTVEPILPSTPSRVLRSSGQSIQSRDRSIINQNVAPQEDIIRTPVAPIAPIVQPILPAAEPEQLVPIVIQPVNNIDFENVEEPKKFTNYLFYVLVFLLLGIYRFNEVLNNEPSLSTSSTPITTASELKLIPDNFYDEYNETVSLYQNEIQEIIQELKPKMEKLSEWNNSFSFPFNIQNNNNITSMNSENKEVKIDLSGATYQPIPVFGEGEELEKLLKQTEELEIEMENLQKTNIGNNENIREKEKEMIHSITSLQQEMTSFSKQMENELSNIVENIEFTQSTLINAQITVEMNEELSSSIDKLSTLIQDFTLEMMERSPNLDLSLEENKLKNVDGNEEDKVNQAMNSLSKLNQLFSHEEQHPSIILPREPWDVAAFYGEQESLAEEFVTKEELPTVMKELISTNLEEAMKRAELQVMSQAPLSTSHMTPVFASSRDGNDNDVITELKDKDYYVQKIESFGVDLAVNARGGSLLRPSKKGTSFPYNAKRFIPYVYYLSKKEKLNDYKIMNAYQPIQYGHCYGMKPKDSFLTIELCQPMEIKAIAIAFYLPHEDFANMNYRINDTSAVKYFTLSFNGDNSNKYPYSFENSLQFHFPKKLPHYFDQDSSHYFQEIENVIVEKKGSTLLNYYEIPENITSSSLIRRIRMKLLSNYGNPELTCMYRVMALGYVPSKQ